LVSSSDLGSEVCPQRRGLAAFFHGLLANCCAPSCCLSVEVQPKASTLEFRCSQLPLEDDETIKVWYKEWKPFME
jgi:hypothetical protein